MKQFSFPYGEGSVEFSVDEKRIIAELEMADTPVLTNVEEKIQAALDNPIASKPLRELVKAGETVAIIVNDPTRIANTHVFLPILVNYLNAVGVKDEDMVVLFALGTHRKMSQEEMVEQIGEEMSQRLRMVNCYAKDSANYIEIGTTSRGTPVRFHKEAVNADHIICTGSVVHHFFAGYGGGRKALFPGCAEYETIRKNHSLMLEEGAEIGHLEGNPIYEDQVEGTEMCRPTFLMNMVLNGDKEFTGIFCGDYIEAHKQACAFVDKQNGVVIDELAPIVIASCGGYPKDINIYQSQKTMDNAVKAVIPGGVVILVAECREGSGSEVFDKTVEEHHSIQSIEDSVRADFQIGRHKAYAVTRLMKKVDFYLISAMEDKKAQTAFFYPFNSVQEALAAAEAKLGKDAKIIIMEHASYTVPILKK